MFFIVAVLTVNTVMLQYDFGRLVTFWISVGLMTVIYLYDFAVLASSKQKAVFYIPMFFETIVFAIGYTLYRFECPERLCRNSRFV